MSFFGRRVLITTLDPVPRPFRCAPGLIAMNRREFEAVARLEGDVFKELVDVVQAEDAAEARNIGVRRRRKVPKAKLPPSSRLFMVNAIYKGRT